MKPVILIAPVLLALPLAAAPASTDSKPTEPRAYVDKQPRVRIRGDDGGGLTRDAFAAWLVDHPGVIIGTRAHRQLEISTGPQRLEQTSGEFELADRNHDGRVSARELASLAMLRESQAPKA